MSLAGHLLLLALAPCSVGATEQRHASKVTRSRSAVHGTCSSLLTLRGGGGDAAAEAKEKLSSWWSSKTAGLNAAMQQKGSIDPDRTKAATLLKKRGASNAGKAADLLRSALKKDPENAEIKMELADALNTVMRIKTNANSLVIEGVQDSPSFKNTWRTLGGEAFPLASDARKAFPSSVKALAVYADSFLYFSSSKGIVKQALTGVGKKYLAIAKELYKYPEQDSCVGCAFLGGFYNVAPWPVGSKQKARQYLREGAKKAPTRRNLYYAAVNAYQMGEFDDARDYFSKALKAPACKSATSTEDDFVEFILSESERGLQLAEKALADRAAQ
jgi:tetratricopeptide (TPR) repeat protein